MRNVRLSLTAGVLSLLVCTSACSRSFKSPLPAVDASLKELARARGIALGVAVDADALKNDNAYRELVRAHFSSITPENAMKLESVCPERDRCTYDDIIYLSAFASTNGMRFRGHPLAWHRQNPQWLSELSPEATLSQLQRHIYILTQIVGSQVDSWDVVNEALVSSGFFRTSIWIEKIGLRYIEDAFVAAYSSSTTGKLFYNDFDLVVNERKRRAVLWLLTALREAGVHIDGVGFQMHLRPTAMPSPEQLAKAFTEVAEADFEIQITELDIAIPVPPEESALVQQGVVACQVAEACLNQTACKAITVWGLSDAHSWIPAVLPGLGAATLFDESLRPKPSFFGLRHALLGNSCSDFSLKDSLS